MSINWWTDKQTVVHLGNRILLSDEEEQTWINLKSITQSERLSDAHNTINQLYFNKNSKRYQMQKVPYILYNIYTVIAHTTVCAKSLQSCQLFVTP